MSVNNKKEQFSRTEMLFGAENMEKLYNARVAVFGLGGVGGYVTEALARSGIGTLDLIDNDKVALSNLNRQIIALTGTIGKYKVDAAKERILDINPCCTVNTYKTFFLPESADDFDFSVYDYVVDAIDTVTGKLAIIEKAKEAGVPVISSMGAGNKLDASRFEVADIYKTSVCPLAKVIRTECRKRGIKDLKVVYSKEPALSPGQLQNSCPAENKEQSSTQRKKAAPGSNSFVPGTAGLIIAGEVIKDLIRMPYHASS